MSAFLTAQTRVRFHRLYSWHSARFLHISHIMEAQYTSSTVHFSIFPVGLTLSLAGLSLYLLCLSGY